MYNIGDINYENMSGFMSERTFLIHKALYATYVENLNKLLPESNITKEDIVNNIDTFEIDIRDELLLNVGGALNHERFFNIINKNNKTLEEPLNQKINQTFGSFDEFKKEFKKNALNIVGSGYTSLVLDKENNLRIINTSNEELSDYYGFTPILTLDMWEHAYILDYDLDKEKYVDTFFDYIDYETLNKLYEEKTK
jgi:Fe-Mn family superoxide dismutase